MADNQPILTSCARRCRPWPQAACNLAVWCVAIQQLRLAVGGRLLSILTAMAELIGTDRPRFTSSTIDYEAMAAYGYRPITASLGHFRLALISVHVAGKLLVQAPEAMANRAETWAPLVCVRLFHENPTCVLPMVGSTRDALSTLDHPLRAASGRRQKRSSRQRCPCSPNTACPLRFRPYVVLLAGALVVDVCADDATATVPRSRAQRRPAGTVQHVSRRGVSRAGKGQACPGHARVGYLNALLCASMMMMIA